MGGTSSRGTHNNTGDGFDSHPSAWAPTSFQEQRSNSGVSAIVPRSAEVIFERRLREIHPAVQHSPAAKRWTFLAATAFWATALSIGLVLIHDSLRHYGEHRLILPADGCYPAWAGWLSIILLSGVFCLALFPEHVFNYHILKAFLERIWTWDGKRPLSELASSARLHGGVILFKLGLPLAWIPMQGKTGGPVTLTTNKQ